MIAPSALRVVSLDETNRVLLWDVVDSSADSYLDYEIIVERSESSEGPYTQVSPPFRAHYRFVDTSIPTGHRFRQLHYRLRLRNLKTQEVDYSTSFTQEPEPDLVAIEIRRHLHYLYREKGRRAWLLPARTFGRRCTVCWDATLGQRTRSHCLQCFDSGFFGGYLYPIEIFIDIDPSGTNTQPSQVGVLQPNSTTARMGHYPGVKERDLIVEGENNRWVVSSMSQTEHMRAPLMQMLNLRQVFPRDTEMKIPLHLNEALEDIWLTPRKMYTESADEDGTVAWATRHLFGIGDRS